MDFVKQTLVAVSPGKVVFWRFLFFVFVLFSPRKKMFQRSRLGACLLTRAFLAPSGWYNFKTLITTSEKYTNEEIGMIQNQPSA